MTIGFSSNWNCHGWRCWYFFKWKIPSCHWSNGTCYKHPFLWAWSLLVHSFGIIWRILIAFLLENQNSFKCQNLYHLHFEYSCRYLQCQKQLWVSFQMLGPLISCLGYLGSTVTIYFPFYWVEVYVAMSFVSVKYCWILFTFLKYWASPSCCLLQFSNYHVLNLLLAIVLLVPMMYGSTELIVEIIIYKETKIDQISGWWQR